MRFSNPLSALLAAALIFGASAAAPAAVISGVTIQDVSSELTQNFSRGAVNVINGSGLNINGSGTASNVPNGTMWLNTGNGCCGGVNNTNATNADSAPQITFNLGSVYTLASIRVWNYNENSGDPNTYTKRGIQDTDISISSDGMTYTPLPGIFTFNKAFGLDTDDFSQTIPLPVTAKYIRLDPISNWGGDNNFYGLSEIQFNGVPEPTTLSLIGVGAFALVLRRKGRAA